jgi:hypothetical protein
VELSNQHQEESRVAVEEGTRARGCCGGEEASGREESERADDATRAGRM